MEVIRGLESFPRQDGPVVLCLGTFDGVHRGHRALIDRALSRARELNGRCAVVTFDPHPVRVISSPPVPVLLTTLPERLDLLAELGTGLAVVVRFDEALRRRSADDWLRALVDATGMRAVFCGPDYSFGHERQGNVELLQRTGARDGFEVHTVPAVKIDGIVVSSTAIRHLVRAGNMKAAARLLGRWYAVRGEVVRGDGRGVELGFPTANVLPPEDKVLPATGIYATLVHTADRVHGAATSVGTRPTFGGKEVVVEAHLLDFGGTLYGDTIRIQFVHRLRDEVTFPSVDALIAQMHGDVAATRRTLAAAAAEPFGES
ncbi:MAG TPA: bifunctional riboflavin kinase/FAD synthetase [bacterium]|jgi:riboflavin kinase/FMN adenylyltransferase|nr:bifunctional riboflavin kinase/FAD synthetase [bacterium]